jgi:hypothetical protein
MDIMGYHSGLANYQSFLTSETIYAGGKSSNHPTGSCEEQSDAESSWTPCVDCFAMLKKSSNSR